MKNQCSQCKGQYEEYNYPQLLLQQGIEIISVPIIIDTERYIQQRLAKKKQSAFGHVKSVENMKKRKCKNCKWYKICTLIWGYCRRFPRPEQVDENHWCGEFKEHKKIIKL